ncbi:hypothetical protein MMC29_000734 [Sticta canariensis]|nr:hypothetical protein [Sticta canariensis]
MTILAFEVEPPSLDSDEARLHVIDYIRLPAMLEQFEEQTGLSLGPSILNNFLPSPMPLDCHKTVIDYATHMMDTWNKDTILVRVPVGNKLTNFVRDNGIIKLRYADIQRRLKKNKTALKKQKKKTNAMEKQLQDATKEFTEEINAMKTQNSYLGKQLQDTTKEITEEINAMKTQNSYLGKRLQDTTNDLRDATNDSIARYDFQFTIFRGNILLDLIRKLHPDEAKKAGHRASGTRWSTIAGNYAEADFKEATKNYDVCNDSAHMMEIFQKFGSFVQERNEAAHQSQLEMARLLTSSLYRKKRYNQFWSRLFEYVYEETVEEVVQKWDGMDETGAA